MNDLFYIASDSEREEGFLEEASYFRCLLCDFKTEKGMIYPFEALYMDAEKAMKKHIEEEHGGVFNYLLALSKKVTGLSEHQSRIVKSFYEKKSDYEIQEELEIGSVSTARNHRSILKEKEKQAKTLVTIMGLLGRVTNDKSKVLKPHKTAKMVDKRYDITEAEAEKVLDRYFLEGRDGKLKTFHMKEKSKLVVLKHVIKNFDVGKHYTQKSVDQILKRIYEDDYVLLRRYLIEYGFLDRKNDGSVYWVKEENVRTNKGKQEKNTMNNKRKELKDKYVAEKADGKIVSGIYQIKNKESGKVFIGQTRNIDNLNRLLFQLRMGSFLNKGLQKEWNTEGESAFEISVLEQFEEDEKNPNKVLRDMERKWKSKLDPYGDRGYHRKL